MCVQENIEAVNTVLEEIDAHEIPTLLVMNKIDMLDDLNRVLTEMKRTNPDPCLAFAQTGAGIPQLFSGFDGASFSGEVAQHILRLPPQEGRLEKSFLSASGNRKRVDGVRTAASLQVRMPIVDWRRLCKQEPALIDYLILTA